MFITVGSLSAQRKTTNSWLRRWKPSAMKGTGTFPSSSWGRRAGKIPGHLRPFLHVAGKLDFPAMYEAMRRADYFLPCLIPAIRRITATLPPASPVPPSLFTDSRKSRLSMRNSASFYGFNDRNALLYRKKRLAAPCPRHQADGRGIRRNAAGASPTGQGY